MRKFKTVARSIDPTDFSIKVLYLMKAVGCYKWEPIGEVRHDKEPVNDEVCQDFNRFLEIRALEPMTFEEIGYLITNSSSNGIPSRLNSIDSIDEMLKLSGMDKSVIDSSRETYKLVCAAFTVIEEAAKAHQITSIEITFDADGNRVFNIKHKEESTKPIDYVAAFVDSEKTDAI
jgi:hypothetical protein